MTIGRIPGASGIQPTIVDAKGDLIAATAADSVTRLAVGTNGQVLTADSAETTGLKWATPAAGGKVLQVVQATYGTQTNIATTTWTDSGLSATITPSAATSKVLVMIAVPFGVYEVASATEIGAGFRILRGTTFIFGDNNASAGYTYGYYLNLSSQTNPTLLAHLSASYLDSPNTTSATTYKLQGSALSGDTCRFFWNSGVGSMILMEIGA
jgi:hypothetical protein